VIRSARFTGGDAAAQRPFLSNRIEFRPPSIIVKIMRRLLIVSLPAFLLAAAISAPAVTTGRVLKVLPHFLDLKGRHALSPSLYDRDAYQAQLRKHPEQRSGIRFDVLWKAQAASGAMLKLRAELRGIAKGALPRQKTLESEVKPSRLSHWTSLTLGGDDYKDFGEVTAWRVTLWDGDQLVGEQKSFLW
jgi:hypothetical protein